MSRGIDPRGRRPARARPRHSRGTGLVEVLVAMTIALLLTAGAVAAFVKGRDAHAAMESTARLQETARYALGVIESDVRMSGYLGLASRAGLVTNLAGPLATPGGVAVVLKGCGPNWATDLSAHLGGWDQSAGAYPLAADCKASGAWRPSTDGLVVRRASADRIAQSGAGLKAYAKHVLIVTSHASGLVFVGDAAGTIPAGYAQSDPPGAPPLADTRRLLVHAYYVSASSSEGPTFPSLRRKRLVAGPAVQDEEIIPGVEDLQVQYGLDSNGDLDADRWVNAGEFGAGEWVVAARVWLRVRALERDPAWSDATHYTYANQDEQLAAAERPFRRVVVGRTLRLRNVGAP
jgi:Tfp pilus assembly protein PilW